MNISPKVYLIEDSGSYIKDVADSLQEKAFEKYGIFLDIEKIDHPKKLKDISVNNNTIILSDFDLKDWGGVFSTNQEDAVTGIDIIKDNVTKDDFFIPCVLFSSHDEDEITKILASKITNHGLNDSVYFKYVDKRESDDDVDIDADNILSKLNKYFTQYFELENIVGIMAREQSEIDRLTLEAVKKLYATAPSAHAHIDRIVSSVDCNESTTDKISRILNDHTSCATPSYHHKCYLETSSINKLSYTQPIFRSVAGHASALGDPILDCNDYKNKRREITSKRNEFCHFFNRSYLETEADVNNIKDIFKNIYVIKDYLKTIR